jgi:NADP-dependent 3-hydroxy acid dehydrogenase YdfG
VVETLRADVRRYDEVERAIQATVTRFGGLDILVNNAGIIRLGSTENATEEEFSEQLEANVLAPYALTRALLPLLERRSGQIVFINSSAGRTANPGVGQYAATKHAIRAFAESLRAEVNNRGIRVTTVYAGRTATPMQQYIHAHEGRSYVPERLLQPSDVAEIVTAALSLPRTAEVTEIFVRPMMKP